MTMRSSTNSSHRLDDLQRLPGRDSLIHFSAPCSLSPTERPAPLDVAKPAEAGNKIGGMV